MNQTSRTRTDARRHARLHASPDDFCAIFERDMGELYSLAFLLTGNSTTAEQCLLDALQDCRTASDVFPEWVRPWSRRAVIKRAMQRVHPRPSDVREQEGLEADEFDTIPRRLLQLTPFERFVFAMGVLERYSLHECATLLGCHVHYVELARITALKALCASREEHVPRSWVDERKQHVAVA
jgi:DNA-directed RNA polymerase specialized sigma24 family protein